ncbi:MAG: hypothetical protein LC687_03660, partial [Actinobacteria bacterium]|nr:hypothetical protein [Actinomycetota bacterium]
GMALEESKAAGTETVATPITSEFSSMLGSLTWGSLVEQSIPREHVININRPLDTDDARLHSAGLNGLDETSFSIDGVMRGIVLTRASYEELMYDATDVLSLAPIFDSLTFKFQTPDMITGAVPYSVQFALPVVEVRLDSFEARDNNSVLVDLSWRMIDESSAQPVVITLVDTVSTYPLVPA